MAKIIAPPRWLSQVKIRHLTQADLEALEWDGDYIHFRRLYQEVYKSMRKGTAIMWVADLPGSGVIGQVFVQLDSSRNELADGKQRSYLYAFRVRSQYRGFGLGSRLLETVEADLARRSFRYITLNVSRDNQAAGRFYKRHGYCVVAAEPGRWSYLDHEGYQQEVDEPAWRMQKELPRLEDTDTM